MIPTDEDMEAEFSMSQYRLTGDVPTIQPNKYWPVETPADRYYAATAALSVMEDEMYALILKACGIRFYDTDQWPMGGLTFDDYDTSFEFKNVKGRWVPTPEMLANLWALGFDRLWVCFDDGYEQYFSKDGIVGDIKFRPKTNATLVSREQKES